MKIIGDCVDKQYSQISIEISVDGAAKFLRRDFALELNVGNLPFRMDARIRPSRPVDSNLAAVQQRQNARQFPLHGSLLILNLPAVKIRPVILQKQAVI